MREVGSNPDRIGNGERRADMKAATLQITRVMQPGVTKVYAYSRGEGVNSDPFEINIGEEIAKGCSEIQIHFGDLELGRFYLPSNYRKFVIDHPSAELLDAVRQYGQGETDGGPVDIALENSKADPQVAVILAYVSDLDVDLEVYLEGPDKVAVYCPGP